MSSRKSDKGKFIEGIYNYCDRWCERCSMTEHCHLFYQDSIRRAKHEQKGEDPNDMRIVIEDVEENIRDTLSMLQKGAAEMGIDLDKADASADAQIKQNRKKRLAHPLHMKAHRFANATHKFLETLSRELHAEKRKSGETQILEEIQECFEVLSWYHMQIAVKIDRALHSRQNENDFGITDARDSDGSAKVAHLG